MSSMIGVVTKVFDNRLKNGQPSPYPNWKIFVGDNEFTAWTGDELVCKQGDNISLHFGISKKTGKAFVESDFETKIPKIQVIPIEEIPVGSAHSEEVPFQDDDISDFPYGANKTIQSPVPSPMINVDRKSLEMFCMAMAKSALESSQLKGDKQSIASFIKDMIEVYKASFK
tara:strand:+ start:763 stop:1275 length:513 start_codon:yes stop_codon:yes gene_type:complete